MNLFYKITALFLISVSILLPAGDLIYAHEQNDLKLPKTIINPGSFYYPFKRLIEKGREKTAFSKEGKKAYYGVLLKTRLSELDYLVEKNILSEVQKGSERFAYQAAILAKFYGKGAESSKLIEEFTKYGSFLEELRDKFPANSSFWMLIQHDINTLKILSEQQK